MRVLNKKEIRKRGCYDCAKAVHNGNGERGLYLCPYSECPCHELDAYDSYLDYLNSDDCKFDFSELPREFYD